MKVTVEEIAKLAGVSKATVSRVLNNVPEGVGEETRRRVLKIIEEMNYAPDFFRASNRAMKSKSIALVLPDITNPFFCGYRKSCRGAGKAGRLHCDPCQYGLFGRVRAEVPKKPDCKKVDGIILVPSGARAQREHSLPGKYGIPLVLLDRKLAGENTWVGVYSDNEYATFRSSEMLINNGARNIAFLSGTAGVSTSMERLEGYKLALKQYGISYNPQLVKYGNYTFESGYAAIMELERAGEKYSAVLAANDMMALGALSALKEFSYKIPEEVELIGFDNISFSQHCDPPLSTIQQPTAEMGTKATEILIKLISGASVTESIRLRPRMVLRKTTK